MCGIVGYTGGRTGYRVLLDSLKHLEYRGYDSAGVALATAEKVYLVRATGKVVHLEKRAHEEIPALAANVPDCAGIAHTRWATHGAPSVANAHPHCDNSGRFAVVHNGIIDNYRQLRSHLEKEGCIFKSETDSEVIAHLIGRFFDGDLTAAVEKALCKLEGTYGIAVVSSLCPGQMVCARRGSPIVIGVGDGENLIASDIAAIVGNTRRVIYLNDGDIALITPDSIDLRTVENVPVEREVTHVDWDADAAQKGEFAHFMLKEIFEQPDAVANTIRGRLNRELNSAKLNGLALSPRDLAGIGRVVLAACGTSMHAAMLGEYFFEDIAGLPAEVEQAAEFRYRNPILTPDTLVIPISQSGETADTLAAVREASNKGALIAAICNVVGSTIAREAGHGIYLHAGPEISVASTKAFTCQVTVLLMMALMFGRNRRMDRVQGKILLEEIASIPDLIRAVLAQNEEIKAIAHKYANMKNFFFIGRGCLYPTALEGALKLKEISYVHAEGYQAAELKHGPIALLDKNFPVVALANDLPGKDKILGNIAECQARKAPVISVVTEGDRDGIALGGDQIRIPRCSRFVAPIPTAVALQLLSYHIAVARGCEVDQPRNLAKSVTVE